LITPKRLAALILLSLLLAGCGPSQSKCNGDFSGLMPKGWTFVSQTALDTDGKGQFQCVVLYRFDTTKDGRKITPVGGVVYRQDHGKPRLIYPHPLKLPEDFYLGEYKVTGRMADILSGSEGPELIIEDTNPDGNIIQASIFSWRDNKKDQLDLDPSSNPDAMSYKPLGSFLGDSGVLVEKDKVTVLKRREGTRSQLSDRQVYLPRESKNYYKQGSTLPLVDPAETDIISLVSGDDPTASPYPEKTVLAFYRDIREDAKVEGLMTPDALGLLKAGKLPYGCAIGRDQLDSVLIQNLDWNRGTEAQPQVLVGGKCKPKTGPAADMAQIVWQLERVDGKWRIKGATQQ
jgi:hypothetical protein